MYNKCIHVFSLSLNLLIVPFGIDCIFQIKKKKRIMKFKKKHNLKIIT